MRSILFASVVLVVSWLGTAAQAGNLILNSGFDVDYVSWAPETHSSITWSSLDSEGNPMSGSALVTNLHPDPNNGQGMVQCLPAVVIPGAAYGFGGKVYIPSGQVNTGDAQVGLRWYDDLNCTGAVVGSQPRLGTITTDVWVALSASGEVAPAGAMSVYFLAFSNKNEGGGSFEAYFDGLSLEMNLPYADGFERGDTSAWSGRVPGIVTMLPYADGSEVDSISRVFCKSGHCPWNPPDQLHDGIDIHPLVDLATFQAVCDGTVESIDMFQNPGNGKYQVNVLVSYAYDQTHLVIYAFEPFSGDPAVGNLQLANIAVDVGTEVFAGDIIGDLVRDDPQAAHVHWGFAINPGQICVDPYLSDAVRDDLLDLVRVAHPDWNLCH